ncbi:DUF4229 domain-containing protein [Marisediminicola antarctica]|uniref:DUF4229 domain-containing protein n=1 Tax=Marisediminicola antarctica TaxID=674079 RepID=A0A7L5AFG5_9MICO|nr:DUF4229 domain-containing protein [Marisediminicola antarctica]QHO68405.1 hypothetical protein BHD05_00875 [Marisediminicola antarctica]
MKSSRQWISYSLLRLGVFAAVLIVLLVLQVEPWIAAVIAAVVGLCVAYIFFRPQREAVARSFWEFRTTAQRDSDSDAENDALDAAATPSASPLEGQGGGEADAEEQGRQAR